MEIREVFVDFKTYCPKCKYADQGGQYDPCNDCIDNPVNTDSAKPIHFKEADLYKNANDT